ncbi:EFR1 family ferrodoxin [Clostridium thailandense]|uniref:EFR1 family ferrodoxin n=1 Tax=Clostridium thailandense TaxID=2794346 RepID=UPI0039891969
MRREGTMNYYFMSASETHWGKLLLFMQHVNEVINHMSDEDKKLYLSCVSAKGFYATDDCTSCGKCAKLCPLNNIEIAEGKPHWGQSCTHCMACICGCPSEAIEYKNKSKGKPRYYNKE